MASDKIYLLVQQRQIELGISLLHLEGLTGVDASQLSRFFSGGDISTDNIKNILQTLGLDENATPAISCENLMNHRAEEKARYMVSLVQDTSSLEGQGLDVAELDLLIEEAKLMFLGEHREKLWAR